MYGRRKKANDYSKYRWSLDRFCPGESTWSSLRVLGVGYLGDSIDPPPLQSRYLGVRQRLPGVRD